MNAANVEQSSQSRQKQVSRGVTAIYKEYLGRGPTQSKTVLSDECVITILTDSMTRAEHALVENGQAETVRDMRRKQQAAMREEITGLVEGVTGRKCASFLSDHDPVNDVAIEVALLAPE